MYHTGQVCVMYILKEAIIHRKNKLSTCATEASCSGLDTTLYVTQQSKHLTGRYKWNLGCMHVHHCGHWFLTCTSQAASMSSMSGCEMNWRESVLKYNLISKSFEMCMSKVPTPSSMMSYPKLLQLDPPLLSMQW